MAAIQVSAGEALGLGATARAFGSYGGPDTRAGGSCLLRMRLSVPCRCVAVVAVVVVVVVVAAASAAAVPWSEFARGLQPVRFYQFFAQDLALLSFTAAAFPVQR